VLFRERTGLDCLALRGAEIRGLIADGLLELSESCLRPTRRGLLFADTIAERLL
jgi:coproporphyrinogen III oxidase-like Fe-S oxidoreductase